MITITAKNKIKSKNAMSIRKIGKNDLQRYFELCNEENWGIGFARIEKMVSGFDFDYFYYSLNNQHLTAILNQIFDFYSQC